MSGQRDVDVDFLLHRLKDAFEVGVAEEMAEAIEDFLLALRQGEIVVGYAEGNSESLDDGVFITSSDVEDLEGFQLDFDYGDMND